MNKTPIDRINKRDAANLFLSGVVFVFISSVSNPTMGLYYAAIILAIYWVPKFMLECEKTKTLNKADMLNIILSISMFILISNASSFSLGLFYSSIIFGIYWIPKLFLKRIGKNFYTNK
ncbi:hypothetical protein [Candidatus Pyrohabitans sp.]